MYKRQIFTDAGVVLILVLALIIYATVYSMAYGAQVLRNVPIGVVDECRTPDVYKRQGLRSTAEARRWLLRSAPQAYCRYIGKSGTRWWIGLKLSLIHILMPMWGVQAAGQINFTPRLFVSGGYSTVRVQRLSLIHISRQGDHGICQRLVACSLKKAFLIVVTVHFREQAMFGAEPRDLLLSLIHI